MDNDMNDSSATKNQRYMLDTNTVSYIIKGEFPSIQQRLISGPMASLCISAITEAELLRGLAKKPEAKHLALAVKEFLIRVDILGILSRLMPMLNYAQRAKKKVSH